MAEGKTRLYLTLELEDEARDGGNSRTDHMWTRTSKADSNHLHELLDIGGH